MMENDAIINKLEQNMRKKFSYLPGLIDGMIVMLQDNMLIINSHIPSDMFNIICIQSLVSREQLLDAVSRFKALDLPFSW